MEIFKLHRAQILLRQITALNRSEAVFTELRPESTTWTPIPAKPPLEAFDSYQSVQLSGEAIF
jgi:hypothetical protein